MSQITDIEPIKWVFLMILGLEVGSFANVCIYRWPRNLSILSPARSHCPWCDAKVLWYDNIPLISFLILRGRCRSCQSPISKRYPLVELILPLLWIALLMILKTKSSNIQFMTLLAFFSLAFVLVVTTFTDLEWKIIPNLATYPLLVIGMASSFWNPYIKGSSYFVKLSTSITGALAAWASLWFIAILGRFFFKKDVMGGGDLKLLAGFGAFLGWKGALITLFLGSLVGGIASLIGLLIGALKRHQYIPFGPFLNVAHFITLFILAKRPEVLDKILTKIFSL